MGFESVRAYLQLASGLSDLTRARAMEAAQGLLTLPASSMATGTKMASQASALADELLAAATANRSNLTELVRDEVEGAITRLGLVPVQRLDQAQAEAARLRKEIATLRSEASKAAAPKGPVKKAAAPKSRVKKAAAPKSPAKKAAATLPAPKKAAAPRSPAKKTTVAKAAAAPVTASAGRSAVTTRSKTPGT